MASKEKQEGPVFEGTGSRRQYYEALVNEYYSDIFRYAYWLSKDRSTAEDLAQETFLRAWRSIDSLENAGAAKAWLFTILRRENARLYEKFRPELDDIEDMELSDKDADTPDQSMERELLYRAMEKLEPDYREPLLLQIVGGFSGEEIANILNLNNNTVMTRLFRARNKLKQELDNS
ncbi:MAG: sigma-70 family RNA polymerase sigma factor [Pseudomonadales bacterium]|nr:sigma-70 family RNA polymerase sigma factor [Pseudomonadales bacterium]